MSVGVIWVALDVFLLWCGLEVFLDGVHPVQAAVAHLVYGTSMC